LEINGLKILVSCSPTNDDTLDSFLVADVKNYFGVRDCCKFPSWSSQERQYSITVHTGCGKKVAP